MRNRVRENTHRRQVSAFVFVLLLAVLGADECPSRQVRRVRDLLVTWIEEPTGLNLDPIPSSLRIHLYPTNLRKDDVVEPYAFDKDPDASKRLTCESDNGCLLFFVDTDHWAHFAHTTAIALWELDNGHLEGPVKDEWWPLLNGKPIYDTVAKREGWHPTDVEPPTIIVYPEDSIPRPRRPDPVGIWVGELPPPQANTVVPTPSPDAGDTEDCNVWAVVVDGYTVDGSTDEDDTFHIDADGIYRTLRGLGVPDDHIHYLCPDLDKAEGCDLEVSKSQLETVLTQTVVAELGALNATDPVCKELLIFYSSHGGAGSLRCGEDSLPHQTLSDWIDGVPYEKIKITVVVEACKSGALLGLLKANVPDGQTRFVFTSTARDDQSTYRDRDRINEETDDNPGDIGSETVWGYVEAFGTGAADTSVALTKISFSEAVEFATANDLTAKVLGNEPGVYEGATPCPPEVHSCAVDPPTPKLKIELTQTPTAPAEFGQLLRCRCNGFSAEISSPGGDPPPVATARFYWTDVAEPKWQKDCGIDDTGAVACTSDFKQVWDSTRMIGSHQEFPVTLDVFWDVGSNMEAGSEITLLAIADSPHLKIPQGEEMPLSDLVADYDQADAITLEVVNPSSCFIFPCGCRTLRCD